VCSPLSVHSHIHTQPCECEEVFCQYEAHTCTDYSDAATTLYHSVNDFTSAYGATGGVPTGQGAGDQHGTQTSTDTHNGAAICAPSVSIRVYHKNGSPALGHHCKIADGSGTCTCRCNTLFKGNYNPRDTDLFDHTIVSDFTLSLDPTVDEPTPSPTNWPTKAPTKEPTKVQPPPLLTPRLTPVSHPSPPPSACLSH
jgi:hypothetical protein